MADPRFYDNRGPYTLGEICAATGLTPPDAVSSNGRIFDLAGLQQAGPQHLTFFDSRRLQDAFRSTRAGWCFVRDATQNDRSAGETVLVSSAAPAASFAAAARLFYPDYEFDIRAQDRGIHPSAKLGKGVILGPGVAVGAHAEIGDGSRIGANAVIGHGVALGRECQVGPHVTIGYSYVGDSVVIQPGAVIGGSGFGFVSGPDGHSKVPQLGRVIVQDRVEIGSNCAIDRGALSDTVIGEGTKIDNLVHIGHNSRLGRHCIIVAMAGLSGSVVLGDGVILGAMSGVAEHVTIGPNARVAAKAGVTRDLEGGQTYGGFPARPIRQWRKETVMLGRLAKHDKRIADE